MRYLSTDNKIFDTPEECAAHERENEERKVKQTALKQNIFSEWDALTKDVREYNEAFPEDKIIIKVSNPNEGSLF